MSQENQLTANDLTPRQKAWIGFANALSMTESKLKLMAETGIAPIKDLPYDVNKIIEYDTTLAQVKRDQVATKEMRLELTRKIDPIYERLMANEKAFDGPIQLYETALLQVKKTKKANDEAALAKTNELARVKEAFANSLSQQHAAFETVIVNKVLACYEACLNNNMDDVAVAENIPKMKAVLDETFFDFKQPPITLTYMTTEQAAGIFSAMKLDQSPASSYVATYHAELFKKFEFYGIAFKNKAATLELAKKEHAEKLSEIANESADAQVANKLQAVAVSAEVLVPTGKPLKSVYNLEMEETEQSVIIIIAAFAANWKDAKEQLGIKKWFNLRVKQMADALVTLKNKDNKFEVTGINFVKMDKL